MLTGYAGFRPQQLEYAVEKGINVFMEKSFASDPPAVREVIEAGEAAEKKNLKIAAGLMCRHSENRQELIKRIRDGQLGEIQLIRAYRMEASARWARARHGKRPLLADPQLCSFCGSPAACGPKWTSTRSTNCAGSRMPTRCRHTASAAEWPTAPIAARTSTPSRPNGPSPRGPRATTWSVTSPTATTSSIHDLRNLGMDEAAHRARERAGESLQQRADPGQALALQRRGGLVGEGLHVDMGVDLVRDLVGQRALDGGLVDERGHVLYVAVGVATPGWRSRPRARRAARGHSPE